MITEVMMKTKLLNRFIITEKEAEHLLGFFYTHSNEKKPEQILGLLNY